MAKTTSSIFLSHTTVDKPSVIRFFEALRHHDDVTQWLDMYNLLPGHDLLVTIPVAVANSSHVILFWSKNALQKYNSQEGVGDLAWLAVEIRTALSAARQYKVKIVTVRLDDSPLPLELGAVLEYNLYVNAIGLLDNTRKDHDLLVWQAANAIIGTIRGRNPLYPPLDLFVNRNGKPVKKKGFSYFQFTWIGGGDGIAGGITGSEYIQSLDCFEKKEHVATLIPALVGKGSGMVCRFAIPNHSPKGWWSASIFFGSSDIGWRTVDLSIYREMRFNARSSDRGTHLEASFVDNQVSSKSLCGYQETSKKRFEIGNFWQTGPPCVLKLDDLDWSVNACAVNTSHVDRRNVNAIVFNNIGQLFSNIGPPWGPGAHWIELKNIVFL